MFCALPCGVFAQPAVSMKIPAQLVGLNGTNIDLGAHFASVPAAGTGVKVTTPFGSFIMELLPQDAPLTVANFLSYVDDKSYDNVMVHRSDPGFVIQTGAYKADANITPISTKSPVPNEFRVSNTRGTVAMARVGGQTNSATSQWFVNLADNLPLDNVDGGFAVFARVRGTGMSVVDQIEALPVITNFAPPFNELPLRDLQPGQTNILVSNFVPLQKITRLPFVVRSSNPDAWSVSLPPGSNMLAIRPGSQAAKTATITVEATDLEGRMTETSFVVKSSPARRYAGIGDSPFGTAGMTLRALPSGAFSAVFSTSSGTKRLKGTFDRLGAQSTEIALDAARRIELRFDPASDVFNISSGSDSFELRPASWVSGGENSPLEGKLFNALLDSGAFGWMQFLFDKVGSAKIAGRLADNTPFTASAFCVLGESAQNPLLPIAVFPRTGKFAAIHGVPSIRSAAGEAGTPPALAGVLSLDRRAAGTSTSSLSGTLWVPPGKDFNVLDGLAASSVDYEIRFAAGGSPAPLPVMFRGIWPSSNRPAAPKGARVSSLKFSAAKGLFSGSVLSDVSPGGQTIRLPFSGLLTGVTSETNEGFRGGGFVVSPSGPYVWSLHSLP